MQRTLVLLVVGLTPKMVGENTPNIQRIAQNGALRRLGAITPAVTCSAQATLMTGLAPTDHGIVANGWYFRDLGEAWLWRQSERLVGGEFLWDAAKKRNASFTCAKLFWWYNMYGSADIAATPRPMYPADGRKLPDVWTQPTKLRDELQEKFGPFPLFKFWGPAADITCSRWIADASKHIYETRKPTLTLVYLPHLDYNLQRLGPDHPDIAKDLRDIDAVCAPLIEAAQKDGTRVVVCSEYGMTKVRAGVHINRALREAGLIEVREELGREVLITGSSDAFAVADHQIAHIYVQKPELIPQVKSLLEKLDGVDVVLDEQGKREYGLAHERSGELVAISKPDRWFTYYYWLDDDKAPDYARTVDIHRKPGYDPVELFIDPTIRLPKLKIASLLAKKMLGFRTLLDVVSLDDTLVKGSHGRITDDPDEGPVFITDAPDLLPEGDIQPTHFKDIVLKHIFD